MYLLLRMTAEESPIQSATYLQAAGVRAVRGGRAGGVEGGQGARGQRRAEVTRQPHLWRCGRLAERAAALSERSQTCLPAIGPSKSTRSPVRH